MIPFIDLAAQQERIQPQINSAIQRVLTHGQYIMGPEIRQLEHKLAEFAGVQHCVTVSNGTDALIAALMAMEVGPGDAVITSPFTFFATVEAIMFVGATPVFADIDPETYNISPAEIENAISRIRTQSSFNLRGIVPVDLYGLPADYSSILKIATEHNLFTIQDSAQAFGAASEERRAPSHCDIGTTSFFPAKPLGCYGDGGAIFTDDPKIAEIVRSIRVHGKGQHKYDNVRIGMNARLDTIQAAILIEKLKIYQEELELRDKIANEYRAAFSQLSSSHLRYQTIPPNFKSAYAQFVIQSPHRDVIASELKAMGIPTVIYYRTAANKLKACQDLPLNAPMPVAEKVSSEILALPFHPYLESQDVELVGNAISTTFSNLNCPSSTPSHTI